MRTTVKKITAIMLCLAMLIAAMSVSVFAGTVKGGKDYSGLKYKHYTYLGDSISWGYGLCDLSPFAAENMFIRVKGSFGDIVGSVLEANSDDVTVVSAACNGARLCEFRSALEKGMHVANPYVHEEDAFSARSIERSRRLVSRESGDYLVENLAKSDLITVTLGANDIAGCAIDAASKLEFLDLDKLGSLTDTKAKINYAFTAIQSIVKNTRQFKAFADTFMAEIKALNQNQKAVIRDIAKIAPNADILVVGYFVPMDTFRLIPGTDSSLLVELFGTVLTTFNDAYESIASEYSNVFYVDAPDASIFFEEGTLFTDALLTIVNDKDKFLLGIHPDAEGCKYIAGRVLDKLVQINANRAAAAAAPSFPARTVGYVVSVVTKSVTNITNKIISGISSLFKK